MTGIDGTTRYLHRFSKRGSELFNGDSPPPTSANESLLIQQIVDRAVEQAIKDERERIAGWIDREVVDVLQVPQSRAVAMSIVHAIRCGDCK